MSPSSYESIHCSRGVSVTAWITIIIMVNNMPHLLCTRYCAKPFLEINSFNSHLMRIIPTVWMGKLRHRAGKWLTQSHTVSKWWNSDKAAGCQASDSTLLTNVHYCLSLPIHSGGEALIYSSEPVTFLGAGQYSTFHSLLLTAAYILHSTSCAAHYSAGETSLC